MIEYRVRKINRYEVTRYSDQNSHVGVQTVASNLTEREANNIAGAMGESELVADKPCIVRYSTEYNVMPPLENGRDVEELLDKCYGTIGLLTIEKDSAIAEALDLAKDVDWFIRMQGSSDAGLKQVVEKAQAFIGKHGENDE